MGKFIIENSIILLTNWSFDLLLLALLFKKPIISFLSNLGTLVINKDGLELRKITTEAKETLNEIKELASTAFIPVLELTAKAGRMGGGPRIEERLNILKEIKDFKLKHNISNTLLEQKILGLNNSILFDTLHAAIGQFNGKDAKLFRETYDLINGDCKNPIYFKCSPNIFELEKILKENNELTSDIEYVLKEASNFMKNNKFEDFNKLKPILNELQDGIA